MKLFRLFCLFISLVVIFLLLHPFYMKQSVYAWIYESVYNNEKVRIDIYSPDVSGVSILGNTEDIKIIYPDDCQKSKDGCVSLSLPITKDWENYNISYKLKGNGKTQIRLRSKDEWKNSKRFPILVDYKDLYINKRMQNMSESSLWFNKFYETPNYDYTDGDTFVISFKARQHHFKWSDFYLLIMSYSGWEISSYKSIGVIIIILTSLGLIYSKRYRHLYCFWILTFLILPLLYVSGDKISEEENRTLAKFPALYSEGKINERFGIDFNDWLSDRFGGRKLFIDSRFFLLYFINNKIANDTLFLADDGWIFPIYDILRVPSLDYQKNAIVKLPEMIEKIDDYFKGKNVQLFIVLEPSRSLLYEKYWETYYHHVTHFEYYEYLKKKLKGRKNIHFIELEDIFEKNKDKVQLYEKDDPHMTLPAVNLMMEKIISELDKDFYEKVKKSISYKDRDCKLFEDNHFADSLGLKSIKDGKVCKEVVIENSQMNIIEKEIGLQESIVSNPYINKDLYILFPCYEKFIFPVLGEFYAHTISVNYNAFEEHDEEALQSKAIAKLKSVNPEATVLIFLSYPTEYTSSRSTVYLEAF